MMLHIPAVNAKALDASRPRFALPPKKIFEDF
jgi:hypothetical protein